jgi:hypothetical protein
MTESKPDRAAPQSKLDIGTPTPPPLAPAKSGVVPPTDASIPSRPRSGPFADRRGSYEVAPRIKDPDIDPGDVIDIDVFFTGYGEIQAAKLFFAPPSGLIDTDQSYSKHSLGAVPNAKPGERIFAFGQAHEKFDEGTTALLFRGLQHKSWTEETNFFDDGVELSSREDLPSALLATERVLLSAPVHFHLQTRSKAASGVHTLHFFFTYFDGNRWRSSVQGVDVRISNWFERHTTALTVTGLILAILGLVSVLADPNVQSLVRKLLGL